MANRWTNLSDLAAKLNTETRSLTVVPRRRPYLHRDEAVYDYKVGHEFVITDQSSPMNGCVVTTCDAHILKKSYGVTHLNIRYNPSLPTVEVAL